MLCTYVQYTKKQTIYCFESYQKVQKRIKIQVKHV